MARTYDALIVGAGPAGSALAIYLARAGWHTLLIDSAGFPRPKVCGECLGAAALPVLRALGLERAVCDAAVVHRDVRIVLPRGPVLPLTLGNEPREAVLGISRRRLDWLLLQRAQACGAEVLLEHRVRRVIVDRGRVRGVEVNEAGPQGARRTLYCRLLVAADGRLSTVVKQTGCVISRGPRLVGFKRHLSAAGAGYPLPAATIDMLSFAGGYLGICGVEEGALNVCGVLPREAVRQARGAIDHALSVALGGQAIGLEDCATAEGHNGWMTVPDVRRQRASPRVEGVLYLGDAMGTIEPLAGQGMSIALRSAALAAEMLLDAGLRTADVMLQRRYESAWNQTFGETISQAARIGWLLKRPALLQSLRTLLPLPRRCQQFVLRSAYRTLNLPAVV